MKKKNIGIGIVLIGLVLFALKPLLTAVIRKRRYNKEILPIKNGMMEHYKRKQQSFPGKKGYIYSLATFSNPDIRFIRGFSKTVNDTTPYYDLTVKTPSGYTSFSRDTTVGQVIGLLINRQRSIPDDEQNRLFNIYFNTGKFTINTHKNRAVSIIRTYLKDSSYQAIFITTTFVKDTSNFSHQLALKRLKQIEKELGKSTTSLHLKITP
ncbi:hypothetical protein ACG2LH_15230 [Zhouia sp. PK063]|uniref:hypothetical protein n=1 Tax=Zhouia sp. PK063 TaxID=3373602 RepID=UPI0037B7C076